MKTPRLALLLTTLLLGLVASPALAAPARSKATKPFVLEKPPFTATPHGQRLSAGVPISDNVRATPTRHSKLGGYPGYTRSMGTKHHAGIDDPPKGNPKTAVSHYYGTRPGRVTAAGPAYANDGKYLGVKVVIETKTPTATYQSKTLHHREALVKKGDVVRNGDPIARGSGFGDQFKSKQAGKPHTHWELRKDGRLINGANGALVPRSKKR